MSEQRGSGSKVSISRRNALRLSAGAVAAVAYGTWRGAIAQSKRVKVGVVFALGGLSNLIAHEEGYYKEAGLDVEMVPADSAAFLIASLSSNQLDVGQGAPSAGLWNAISRGIDIKVVADSAHSDPTPPGFPTFQFVVRKALIDSGRVKGPADLKGLKFTMPAPGIGAEVELGILLKQGGLTKQDLQISYMGLSDAVAAMASGAIDWAITSDPFTSVMVTQGSAVLFKRSDEVLPGGNSGVILFSPNFTKSDLAVSWMTGYLRGVRLYNDAVVKRIPAARDKLLATAVKYLPIKEVGRYERFLFPGVDTAGQISVPALNLQQDVFLAAGTQQNRVDVTKAIDMRFANAAVAKLGPYR